MVSPTAVGKSSLHSNNCCRRCSSRVAGNFTCLPRITCYTKTLFFSGDVGKQRTQTWVELTPFWQTGSGALPMSLVLYKSQERQSWTIQWDWVDSCPVILLILELSKGVHLDKVASPWSQHHLTWNRNLLFLTKLNFRFNNLGLNNEHLKWIDNAQITDKITAQSWSLKH